MFFKDSLPPEMETHIHQFLSVSQVLAMRGVSKSVYKNANRSLASVQWPVTIDRTTVLDAYNHLEKLCDSNVNVSSVNIKRLLGARNYDKFTLLHLAAKHGRVDVAKKILAAKPSDLNKGDLRDRTPLHIAVENNRIDFVKWLVTNKDIEVNKRSARYRVCVYKKTLAAGNKTPLMDAKQRGYKEIAKILKSLG